MRLTTKPALAVLCQKQSSGRAAGPHRGGPCIRSGITAYCESPNPQTIRLFTRVSEEFHKRICRNYGRANNADPITNSPSQLKWPNERVLNIASKDLSSLGMPCYSLTILTSRTIAPHHHARQFRAFLGTFYRVVFCNSSGQSSRINPSSVREEVKGK